jgi:hypothetical protein
MNELSLQPAICRISNPALPRTARGIFDKRDPPEADKSPLCSDKQRGIRT